MEEGSEGQDYRRKAKIYQAQGDENIREKLNMTMHQSSEPQEDDQQASKQQEDSEQEQEEETEEASVEEETEAMKKLKKYLLNKSGRNRMQ